MITYFRQRTTTMTSDMRIEQYRQFSWCCPLHDDFWYENRKPVWITSHLWESEGLLKHHSVPWCGKSWHQHYKSPSHYIQQHWHPLHVEIAVQLLSTIWIQQWERHTDCKKRWCHPRNSEMLNQEQRKEFYNFCWTKFPWTQFLTFSFSVTCWAFLQRTTSMFSEVIPCKKSLLANGWEGLRSGEQVDQVGSRLCQKSSSNRSEGLGTAAWAVNTVGRCGKSRRISPANETPCVRSRPSELLLQRENAEDRVDEKTWRGTGQLHLRSARGDFLRQTEMAFNTFSPNLTTSPILFLVFFMTKDTYNSILNGSHKKPCWKHQ